MRIYSVGDIVFFYELYDGDGDLIELLLDGCICVEDGTKQVFYDFDVLDKDISLDTEDEAMYLDTEVLITDVCIYEK